jgi:hypothetical protein
MSKQTGPQNKQTKNTHVSLKPLSGPTQTPKKKKKKETLHAVVAVAAI